jgi:uncharacterized protein
MIVKQDAMSPTSTSDQARLVESLRHPSPYPHTVGSIATVETHISYVLLTGRYAYKIKKAVDLGFLNFETLAARQFYCHEEVRLNRQLAPWIYLDVVPITGSVQRPVVGGSGPALEYAVKMRQFDKGALLSDVLARDELTAGQIDVLAVEVASFHERAGTVPSGLPFGSPQAIIEPAMQNFAQLLTAVDDPKDRSELRALLDWTEGEHARCIPLFDHRRRGGFVRECHGDLHLGNIALIDGHPTLFDRIEFNASLRWIDVMNDVAFMVMDLHDRRRPDLAARFLTGYLEKTGDYEGLEVMRFYFVYRAMVRAKVAQFRLHQMSAGQDRDRLLSEYGTYMHLATRETQPHKPAVIVTHGVTGSGKTRSSQALVEAIGAVRIRSDVERKRLQGVEADARTASAVGEGLYTEDLTRRTYDRVCSVVRSVAAAGYIVIADAAFLKRWQRDLLRALALDLDVPFVIVSCSAPPTTLRDRVMRRLERGEDASEANLLVLEAQLLTQEPLTDEEQPYVIPCETTSPTAIGDAATLISNRIAGGQEREAQAASLEGQRYSM